MTRKNFTCFFLFIQYSNFIEKSNFLKDFSSSSFKFQVCKGMNSHKYIAEQTKER